MELNHALHDCRAVVAYVTSRRPPVGVLLEIGAGLGRDLPVLIVLGPKVRSSSLPVALRELHSMRLPTDVSADGVERFVSLLSTIVQASAPSWTEPSEGGREKWADESERLAAQALQRLGAGIVGYEPSNRRGKPDLAAWLPDFAGGPYNPALVEVAGRNPDLKAKEAQLRSYMENADALVGLLVVQGVFEPVWHVESSRAVMVVGARNLADMRQEDFLRFLRDGRNRLFHAS